MKQKLLKTFVLGLLALTGATTAWGTDFTPTLDVSYRTNNNNDGWNDNSYPKVASSTNNEFECVAKNGMFVLQKYTVDNLAQVKKLTLTLTNGQGADALAIWAFSNTTWDANTSATDIVTAYTTAVGVAPRAESGTLNTPLKNEQNTKGDANTFVIEGTQLTTLKNAAKDNTFTLLITNKTGEILSSTTGRKFCSSGNSDEAKRPRLTAEYYPAAIGSTYYETLNAAVTAAQDNDVITVLTNTESTALDITKAITIKPATDGIVITRVSSVAASTQWLKLGAALTIGDATHHLILDGGNASASTDMIRTTYDNTSSAINMTNVTIQNYTSSGMVMINSKGKINMTDVTFKNCSSTGNGILQTEITSGVTFGGTLTFTDCTGNELAQKDACRFVISNGAKFAAPMKLKLNTEGYDKLALIFNNSSDAATYSRYFIIANDGYGLYQSKNNGTFEFSTTEAYTLTVNQYGASTLVLPYAATLPLGITAYKLTYTSGEDHVTATEVTDAALAANTPVLINAEPGSYKFANTEKVTTATTGSGTPTAGALVGTYTANTAVTAGNYVLYASESNPIGFYKANSNVTIGANHAYLKSDGGSLARLSIVFDQESTGISTISMHKNDDGACYNLQGVRVQQPAKGIYVKNGKKYFVK